MAQELTATFSGPLDSFSINLALNNATRSDIRAFGISSRTAKFPIIWDSFGTASGPATVTSLNGVDTEVLMARLSNFGPGETLTFTGIDPDFTGDSSSGVRVLDMQGAHAIAIFSDGTTGFGVFDVDDNGTLTAVMTK
ncbi:MAG: hypothetical protein V3V13_09140 [Paracoccaceae bacterium]